MEVLRGPRVRAIKVSFRKMTLGRKRVVSGVVPSKLRRVHLRSTRLPCRYTVVRQVTVRCRGERVCSEPPRNLRYRKKPDGAARDWNIEALHSILRLSPVLIGF